MARNCWEIMGCGREPEGYNVGKHGLCPVTTDVASNGVNSGKNAGRYCWRVAGTLCSGEAEGLAAKDSATCIACKFYLHVKKQESEAFVM